MNACVCTYVFLFLGGKNAFLFCFILALMYYCFTYSFNNEKCMFIRMLVNFAVVLSIMKFHCYGINTEMLVSLHV